MTADLLTAPAVVVAQRGKLISKRAENMRLVCRTEPTRPLGSSTSKCDRPTLPAFLIDPTAAPDASVIV